MKKTILILTILILIFSCDNKKSELDFEKNVMLEIYPSLIDSLWIRSGSAVFPPPVKLNKYDSIGNQKLNKNELLKLYSKNLSEVRLKNAKIFVTIFDTIAAIKQNDKKELTKYFKDAIVSKSKENDTLKYPIDQKKFNTINQTKIKFISKFRMFDDPLETNYHRFSIYGVISFSRIQFDTQKKYGILTCDVICGGECGNGYRIFIKKVNDKWVIDKVEEVWVA